MKSITPKFAICAALIFGFLLPVASQAKDHPGHHRSGITGFVNGGPFNLGELIVTVEVYSGTGAFVTSLEIDENGFFEADLGPGDYVLRAFLAFRPVPGQLVPALIVVGPPTSVRVVKNRFTSVSLQFTLP